MFKDKFKTEWQRLNPVYTSADDGFFKAMWNASRESLPGYFAPDRFACWMVKRIWPYGHEPIKSIPRRKA